MSETAFDPNTICPSNGNYFALPVSEEDASIVLVRVPWDATVSYAEGTAEGPEAIMNAALQVDLFSEDVPRAWELPSWTAPYSEEIEALSVEARSVAKKVIDAIESGQQPLTEDIAYVNAASEKVNDYVRETSARYIAEGKTVGVVGGEHSCPLGLIQALGDRYKSFGILHLDAHADLRKCYEGFEYSHASIMYNALKCNGVKALTQVAIRDFCSDEYRLVRSEPRVSFFSDSAIKREIFCGGCWGEIASRIVDTMPHNVYISFDIDSLDPSLCPNTGTPVPGGLSFAEAEYLLALIANSGRRIIGFDLCEVAPGESGEWDANVGARMLFKLLLNVWRSQVLPR